MNLERERLNSFVDVATRQYRQTDGQYNVRDWAHEGLYWPNEMKAQNVFAVRCAFCQLLIDESLLRCKTNAKHVHMEMQGRDGRPPCPFVRGLPTNNLPIVRDGTAGGSYEDLGIHTNKHPSMDVLQRRLDTFLTWPQGHCKTPDGLARNGFFYEGSDDMVICFSCGVETGSWESDENMRERHCESCPFLIGKELQHIDQERSPELRRVTGTALQRAMQSPVVLDALSLHQLRREFVEEVVLNGLEKGETFQSVKELLVAVTKHERRVLTKQKAIAIKKLRTCKVCLDRLVAVLLLPCKHVVTCRSCSDALMMCPMCRSYIAARRQISF